MKVLITGSSGSFGTLITRDLVSRKIFVVGLDYRISDCITEGEYFRFYKCCITDKKYLRDIFTKEQPDHVIHFACTFNRVRNIKREYDIDVNGSGNILEISNETPSVRQFLYASSALAYGGHKDNPEWLSETHPLRPGKLRYGLNKKRVEELYSKMTVRNDLKVSILRVCTVVGPDFGKPASVVYILLKWSWLPEFCRKNRLQFLHTEDFKSLIGLILNDENITGTFNIAPDTYSVVNDLFDDKKYLIFPPGIIKGLLALLYGLRILNLQPGGINNSLYPLVLDPSKLVSRFGYRFRYTSDEAFTTAGINLQIDKRLNLRQE